MTNKNEDSILTISELSEYLRIPVDSLYKIVQKGAIPGVKIGKHWRFQKSQIDKWFGDNGKK